MGEKWTSLEELKLMGHSGHTGVAESDATVLSVLQGKRGAEGPAEEICGCCPNAEERRQPEH